MASATSGFACNGALEFPSPGLSATLSPSDGAREAARAVGAPYVLLLKDNTRPQRNIRVAFGESADIFRVACLSLIVAGMVGLKLASPQ